MDPRELKERERWERLLAWMCTKGFDPSQIPVEPRTREGAGRGLFVTRTLHPSRKPFLVIPAAALLNSRTLRKLYRSIPLEGFTGSSSSNRLVLSGIQILSIHLALHRPAGESPSHDPHFGPYIDSLPRVFDSHPLVWIVKQRLGKAGPHESTLLSSLPPSVSTELQTVAKRFWSDWEVASKSKEVYLEELRSKNEALYDLDGFLWGWLVVNSRSLYSDLFRRKLPQSNLTLCPVIDFANHTSSSSLPRAIWRDTPKNIRNHRGAEILKAHDYVFLPPERTVNVGDEIFLKYGEHSNRTLFTEYGFVDESADEDVDVSDLVDELITEKRTPKIIKELLPDIAHHFMSDLKLYGVPPPSHASWSLECVLRLINLEFHSISDIDLIIGSTDVEKTLKPWRDVTLGEAELVSNENETLVRQDLEAICKDLVFRSSKGVQRLKENEASQRAIGCEWYMWAKGCIVGLWEEEARVASSVLDWLESSQGMWRSLEARRL